MAAHLQNDIEAIHRLVNIEDTPVVVFSRDEISEETLMASGNFELFWYAFYDGKFYGSMEILPNLDNVEEQVELLLKQAKQTIEQLKKGDL